MIPGGRLTLVSGKAVMDADTTSTTLFYAPYNSDTFPVLDGSLVWQIKTFTTSPTDQVGASMAGGAKWAAGSSRDVFGSISGTICSGPAWPASDLPSRKMVRYNGVLVNSIAVTCDTSASASISCPQFQCTYLGSINSSVAGQLTAQFSYGTDRKFEVWTAYAQNQINITLHVGLIGGDYIPSNQYAAASPNAGFLPFNNNTTVRANVFTGLPTHVDVAFHESAFINSLSGPSGTLAAIGWNGVVSGYWTINSSDNNLEADSAGGVARYSNSAAVGLNTAGMYIAKANTATSTIRGGASSPPWTTKELNSCLLATFKG